MQLNIIIVNMSYFKNTILIVSPLLEQFLYSPLYTVGFGYTV